ncbi:DUF4436 family protein [Methylocella tundrae]|uniref:DUF4436 domain-containing protein n=1 Tax=Methylocella tundrae TaxID=227605 RepID=A0A4U8Z600_METTU|nr:DUF4436 family protein [Methylocella tundrae]WPP04346.1 DUF4436 family protein [Methylocella tundrae]VFU10689.1 conserved membrane protein of unknown function [Methylocella tundrae]
MNASPTPDAAPPDGQAAPAARIRRPRLAALCLALSVLGVGYAVLISDFYHLTEPTESVFRERQADARPPLDIYLEVLAVEPARQAIEVRLDFATQSNSGAPRFPGLPGTDILVEVNDGGDVQEIALQAGQPAISKTLSLSVDGPFENYPLDRYDGTLRIRAIEGKDAAGGISVPLRLRTWENIASWEVAMSPRYAAAGDKGLSLHVRAQRPSAQILFAFVVFAGMILLAASALTIGGLVFLGARKIEAALTGALGAMIFAVPMLRNVLPGAPPLGVRADAFVFLWVQIGVILGLALFVAAWARRGPPP